MVSDEIVALSAKMQDAFDCAWVRATVTPSSFVDTDVLIHMDKEDVFSLIYLLQTKQVWK
jgi:hypothetical protein